MPGSRAKAKTVQLFTTSASGSATSASTAGVPAVTGNAKWVIGSAAAALAMMVFELLRRLSLRAMGAFQPSQDLKWTIRGAAATLGMVICRRIVGVVFGQWHIILTSGCSDDYGYEQWSQP